MLSHFSDLKNDVRSAHDKPLNFQLNTCLILQLMFMTKYRNFAGDFLSRVLESRMTYNYRQVSNYATENSSLFITVWAGIA